MRIIEQVSEDEVIAEFLKGELNSKRFGKKILGILGKGKKSKRILLNPNLESKKENMYRKKLLGKTRGFEKNKKICQLPRTKVRSVTNSNVSTDFPQYNI